MIEYQKLLDMARHDYLTGLATRWYLQEYIEENKNEKFLTCIYFDIDNFKLINDSYGHNEGDKVLARAAKIIQEEFSDGFAVRIGGDEFIVILKGFIAADEIQKRVEDFIKSQEISISAGIAQKTQTENKTIEELINESDRALYEAKKRKDIMSLRHKN